MRFQATYNHREAFQPQTLFYPTLGPKWTFHWLSFVQVDVPTDIDDPAQTVALYVRGAGVDRFNDYDVTTHTFGRDIRTQAQLVRTGVDSYERRLPDGSKEVFDYAYGVTPRRVFMTGWSDAYGHSVTFQYQVSGGNVQLVAVSDALGQVTTLEYDGAVVTKVSDPFGRAARLEYTGGRLTKITDVLQPDPSFSS